MTIETILQEVLQREGGFVNRPEDRGGPTKWGITQATLADWRGKPVTAADVEQLSQPEALRIYRQRYVERPGFAAPEIPDALRAQLIDFGIHSGPRIAIAKLQYLLHVEGDGVLGPATLAALVAHPNPAALNNQLVASRLRMIGRLITKVPSQAKFAAGWINRALEFLAV